MWHVWRKEEESRVLRWGNLREKDNLEDQGLEERTIVKRIFKNLLGELGLV
jgi:hypothetical protein